MNTYLSSTIADGKAANTFHLINIEADFGNPFPINLRDLHVGLESKRGFPNWADRKLSLFVDGQDYIVLSPMGQNPKGGRPKIEYSVTSDCAKHIALMENTERGREVRQYFIACEAEFRRVSGVLRGANKGMEELVGKMVDSVEKLNSTVRRIANRLEKLESDSTGLATGRLVTAAPAEEQTDADDALQLVTEVMKDRERGGKVPFQEIYTAAEVLNLPGFDRRGFGERIRERVASPSVLAEYGKRVRKLIDGKIFVVEGRRWRVRKSAASRGSQYMFFLED